MEDTEETISICQAYQKVYKLRKEQSPIKQPIDPDDAPDAETPIDLLVQETIIEA